MAITRKTDAELPGPWLLDKDALLELDKIIDEGWGRFETTQKKEINRVIRREYAKASSYYGMLSGDKQKDERKRIRHRVKTSPEFSARKREITIHFKSGKKVPPVTKFSEAFAHPDMAAEVATHFDLIVVHGTAKAEVRLSTLWSDRLQINVSPPEGEGCYELYVELHQWAERKQPHPLIVRWSKYAGLHWVLIVFFLWFLSLVSGVIRQSSYDGLKAEARKMLADGFTKDQDHKAIELLLAINSGYAPQRTQSGFDTWFLVLFVGSLVVGFMFSYAPRSRLAIGKSANSIACQRLWIHFVSKWLVGGVILALITASFRSSIATLFGF